MILDTGVWIRWVQDAPDLPATHRRALDNAGATPIGVSVFSCWEVAKLVELNRITLPEVIDTWIAKALSYPGVELLPLTPEIAIESTRLPGGFHSDSADQIIVATARIYDRVLLTMDRKILAYHDVKVMR